MTTRERVDSPVIRRIFEAYRMDADDQIRMYEQIERQLTIVYRQTIQAQLNLYGCQKVVSESIDPASSQWIQAKARKDAEGIAQTYDRELMGQIQKVRAGNIRANRFAYMRAIDTWIAQRNIFKSASISLNTMTAARKYAQDRFTRENNIGGKWVLVGPPPVCKKCVRIKALGPITYEQTQKPNNALPQHVNCPHRYQQLIPKKIECGPNTWTG